MTSSISVHIFPSPKKDFSFLRINQGNYAGAIEDGNYVLSVNAQSTRAFGRIGSATFKVNLLSLLLFVLSFQPQTSCEKIGSAIFKVNLLSLLFFGLSFKPQTSFERIGSATLQNRIFPPIKRRILSLPNGKFSSFKEMSCIMTTCWNVQRPSKPTSALDSLILAALEKCPGEAKIRLGHICFRVGLSLQELSNSARHDINYAAEA